MVKTVRLLPLASMIIMAMNYIGAPVDGAKKILTTTTKMNDTKEIDNGIARR